MRNLIKVVSVCGFLVLAAPTFAQISFDIHIGPPPPHREVIVAAPYPEAVWIPGYNRWDYGEQGYIWVPGRYERPPHPGYVWYGPRYPRRGGRYGFVDGHWGDRGRGHGDRGHGRK
jgi:hypothetical protein